jgi:hypothetical protein
MDNRTRPVDQPMYISTGLQLQWLFIRSTFHQTWLVSRKRAGGHLKTRDPPFSQRGTPMIFLSRPPPSSRVKVYAFSTVIVLPLQSPNYQVSAVLGVSTQLSTPVRCILDTGAVSNIIRLGVLPDIWERYRVREATKPTIIGSGGRRIRKCGTVALQVELGKASNVRSIYCCRELSGRLYPGLPMNQQTGYCYSPGRKSCPSG